MMKVFRILFLFCGLAAIIYSCKKDHRVLSSAVQPENDELQTIPGERHPVTMHTIYHDSIVSLNDNIKFLGSNNDGNFGTTTIGLYLNANIPGSIDFGASPVLEKAELVFAVPKTSPINGDKDASLTYSVYPLDSSLMVDRPYFSSHKNLHNKNKLLCNSAIKFSVDTTNSAVSFVRVPIDSLYAAGIMADKASLANNTAFLAAYKGFYIIASAGSGSVGLIYQCDLDNAESGLVFHYRPTPTGEKTSYRFAFTGSDAVKYNTLTFEPGSAIAGQLAGDSAQGAQINYLRGMGATKFKVQIPFLKNRSDSFYYSVNRAEVTIYLDPDFLSVTDFVPPDRLCLLPSDSLGREILTVDQRNSTYVGRYDGFGKRQGGINNPIYKYVFNMPLHAQQILNGTRKNYGFYLVMADPAPPTTARRDNYFQRVVFGGHARVSPPELNISYTRVGKN